MFEILWGDPSTVNKTQQYQEKSDCNNCSSSGYGPLNTLRKCLSFFSFWSNEDPARESNGLELHVTTSLGVDDNAKAIAIANSIANATVHGNGNTFSNAIGNAIGDAFVRSFGSDGLSKIKIFGEGFANGIAEAYARADSTGNTWWNFLPSPTVCYLYLMNYLLLVTFFVWIIMTVCTRGLTEVNATISVGLFVIHLGVLMYLFEPIEILVRRIQEESNPVFVSTLLERGVLGSFIIAMLGLTIAAFFTVPVNVVNTTLIHLSLASIIFGYVRHLQGFTLVQSSILPR
ncbi:hypothetical protein FT663_03172 [Candidozyma haemuli var. vulneris]|uniref:Uncharacterized protein n=1 Tax=Candidozyma haemuli TaxID=45357 RepID=A0A2V1AK10_9ASCO|nr:hypothetical protein CXQ85_000919 [[Candida] haemuloni]KAF3985201.1 hypothetical protein FT662_05290 [[Candida] haemuloni var. vulneris]KAF3990414.1 hypothetical protein FT663_03172 [[Candida] haemuloni var. vulneris]PVH18637.1 hypothetical protein CXQ85_000919 [[Candida] haemuloni]